MKVAVDKDTCIGCALCESVCEEVFIMDLNGKSTVKAQPANDEVMEKAKEAETSCPVNAISIE